MLDARYSDLEYFVILQSEDLEFDSLWSVFWIYLYFLCAREVGVIDTHTGLR